MLLLPQDAEGRVSPAHGSLFHREEQHVWLEVSAVSKYPTGNLVLILVSSRELGLDFQAYVRYGAHQLVKLRIPSAWPRGLAAHNLQKLRRKALFLSCHHVEKLAGFHAMV